MSVNKAVDFYTAVPKMHNCAEAVADGFGRVEIMEQMKKSGGGRAPDGLCGALYAALTVLPPEISETVLAEFAAAAGSDKCKEIKGSTRTSCADCVRIAAELVQKYSNKEG